MNSPRRLNRKDPQFWVLYHRREAFLPEEHQTGQIPSQQTGKSVSENPRLSMVPPVVRTPQNRIPPKRESPRNRNDFKDFPRFSAVGVARLELAASTSQMSHPTNWATPRREYYTPPGPFCQARDAISPRPPLPVQPGRGIRPPPGFGSIPRPARLPRCPGSSPRDNSRRT